MYSTIRVSRSVGVTADCPESAGSLLGKSPSSHSKLSLPRVEISRRKKIIQLAYTQIGILPLLSGAYYLSLECHHYETIDFSLLCTQLYASTWHLYVIQ